MSEIEKVIKTCTTTKKNKKTNIQQLWEPGTIKRIAVCYF